MTCPVQTTPRTPIEAWPARPAGGRAGYSARHFAALAGAQEDPLRVAERLAARADGARIAALASERLAAGDDFEAVIAWQTDAISVAGQARWARLCASFDDVIDVLSSQPKTPILARLLRDARRAKEAAPDPEAF